ncbi:MAG TPA: c-type cytochrome [Terriglobia bacterium]|nr:c-type cytochrome [Terriglobia bacterium]
MQMSFVTSRFRFFSAPLCLCVGRSFAVTSSLVLLLVGLSACRQKSVAAKTDALAQAYDTEPDWNDATKAIPLNYQQAQGKRLFYADCVWCHADATPAGPSNRSNVTPAPSLMNDGDKLNGLSDEYMENMIALGGAAMGKSAMMPPWGRTLSQEEIRAIIAFARAIAQPPYQAPAHQGPKYSAK